MRALACLLVLASLASGAEAPEEFRFLPEKAVLAGPGRTLPAVHLDPRLPGTVLDGVRVETSPDQVMRRDPATGRAIWTATVPGSAGIEVLAAGGGVVYLRAWKHPGSPPNESAWTLIDEGTIRRLGLEEGNWLDPLSLASGKGNGPWTGGDVDAVVAEGKRVAVLCRKPPESDEEGARGTALVLGYAPGAVRPTWTRSVPGPAVPALPSAMNLAPEDSPALQSGPRPLSQFGDTVFVIAGSREPLLALEADTGRVRWTLEAPWEFERGFAGPSAWFHYLARVESKPPPKEDAEEDDRLRTPRGGRIVGGPFVVPYRGTDGAEGDEVEDGYRLFVATARDLSPFPGRLLETRIYEINHRGNPVAVIPLPRPVIASDGEVVEGGVVWRAEGDASLCVCPSVQKAGSGSGDIGVTDKIGRLAWWREPPAFEVPGDAFLRTGRGRSKGGREGTRTALPAGGGWMADGEDRMLRFPVVLEGFGPGLDGIAELRLPFEGKLPEPESRRSSGWVRTGRRHGEGFRTTWQVSGPYLAALSRIDVREGNLEVRFDLEDGSPVVLGFRP